MKFKKGDLVMHYNNLYVITRIDLNLVSIKSMYGRDYCADISYLKKASNRDIKKKLNDMVLISVVQEVLKLPILD